MTKQYIIAIACILILSSYLYRKTYTNRQNDNSSLYNLSTQNFENSPDTNIQKSLNIELVQPTPIDLEGPDQSFVDITPQYPDEEKQENEFIDYQVIANDIGLTNMTKLIKSPTQLSKNFFESNLQRISGKKAEEEIKNGQYNGTIYFPKGSLYERDGYWLIEIGIDGKSLDLDQGASFYSGKTDIVLKSKNDELLMQSSHDGSLSDAFKITSSSNQKDETPIYLKISDTTFLELYSNNNGFVGNFYIVPEHLNEFLRLGIVKIQKKLDTDF